MLTSVDARAIVALAGVLSVNLNETVGLAVRQGPQEHRIDHAEDGRVGPDPQAQREDRDRREGGTPSQSAEREADVAPQCVDQSSMRRRRDPRRRIVGHAAFRPALERDQERILHGLLGAVEIAQDARQQRDRLPRLAPEQAVGKDVLVGRQEAADPEAALSIDGRLS